LSGVETELADELDELAASMLRGEVVPLLGAGVNLCGRPADFTWVPRDSSLPDGRELATYLAEEFKAPYDLAMSKDLIRVSQFIDSVKNSGGRLAGELHDIFDVDGLEPGPMHLFLAKAATVVREQGRLRQIPVILTTNYDYLLERAFEQAGEPYDLITYVATSPKEHVGRFMHSAPGKPPQPIENATDYRLGQPETRTVIVKLHGHVVRRGLDELDESEDAPEDNYVITEDNYIDYLTHTDLHLLLPKVVLKTLRNSSYLFLGYGMKDWNLRAILRRIWGEQTRSWRSWAIQRDVDPIEQAFWEKRSVEIIKLELENYIELLSDALDKRIEKPAQ
jgi:hypothetical protein